MLAQHPTSYPGSKAVGECGKTLRKRRAIADISLRRYDLKCFDKPVTPVELQPPAISAHRGPQRPTFNFPQIRSRHMSRLLQCASRNAWTAATVSNSTQPLSMTHAKPSRLQASIHMGPPAQQEYDVVVIGLGAFGSAAAYHLAKAGVRSKPLCLPVRAASPLLLALYMHWLSGLRCTLAGWIQTEESHEPVAGAGAGH